MDHHFISAHNPSPLDAIVVVSLEPTFHFMTKREMGIISTSATASACSGETYHGDLEGYSA